MLGSILPVNSVASTASAAKPAEEGFGILDFFGEVLDIVNPLQHLPIVSNIYRNLTGDTMSGFANIAGGALFGGPIGGGMALASEVFKGATGSSPEGAVVASFTGQETKSDPVTVQKTQEAYANTTTRMRTTTADWLNPNFDSGTATSVVA